MIEKLKELGFTVLDACKTESKPRVELYIMGDCNDADYAETTTEFYLDNPGDVETLKEVIVFLKTDDNYNIIMTPHFFIDHYDLADDFEMTEDEMEELYNTTLDTLDIPSDQCDICHTLYHLDFTYIDENGTRHPLSLGLEGEEHREVVEIIDRDYEKDCEDDGYADEDYDE